MSIRLTTSDCTPILLYLQAVEGDLSPSKRAFLERMTQVASTTGTFYAFDATCRKNCLPLWTFTAEKSIISSPAVAGGLVYVGSTGDRLYVFDATCRKSCLPLWTFSMGSNSVYEPDITSSPAVADGLVYIGSSDGKFYVFGFPG